MQKVRDDIERIRHLTFVIRNNLERMPEVINMSTGVNRAGALDRVFEDLETTRSMIERLALGLVEFFDDKNTNSMKSRDLM